MGKESKIIRNSILLALAVIVLTFAIPTAAQTAEQQPKPKSEAPKTDSAAHDKGASDKGNAEKAVKPSGLTTLHIEITAGEKDQPVDSASVYVRFPEARMLRGEKLAEMNVKTNREGLVKVPNVPRGKALIQVIAPGWKTFGRWYDLDQAEQTIKIKLEKPHRWY